MVRKGRTSAPARITNSAFRSGCPLKLSEVAARIAFTSPGNLSRLFRRHHGLGFQAYLQKLRLEKAAEHLATTRLPVARIARRVGYGDVSRFGQHFKRRFGRTPAAFHREAGKAERWHSAFGRTWRNPPTNGSGLIRGGFLPTVSPR